MTTGPRRILVVRLSAIGDVLHALPAAVALKHARPGVVLDWLVEDRAAAVLEGHPAIDRLHRVPRARWRRALRRPWSWPGARGRSRRARRSPLEAPLRRLLGPPGQSQVRPVCPRLRRSPTRGVLLRRRARGQRLLHERSGRSARARRPPCRARAPRRLRARAAPLPYAGTGLETPSPDTGDARAFTDAELTRAGLAPKSFVLLHVGTSGFGAFKRWPPWHFARLADRIASSTSLRVAISGAPGEEPIVDDVRRRASVATTALITPTLAALAEVCRRAAAFVSADTGPLHLAAAVGTPVVGLYGPKDAAVYGPYGRRPDGSVGALDTVTRDDVPCRPCTVRWCPEPVCMSAIEPDDVVRALRHAVASDPRPGDAMPVVESSLPRPRAHPHGRGHRRI